MIDEQPFRIRHDQRFKDLLKARFEDLLRLAIPAIAPHLDASRAEFLEQEIFSDLPQGIQNKADIVAKVPTDNQQVELILVHMEVEGQASSGMGARLHRYNAQLHLRHSLPVIPIVIFIRGGKPDVQVEAYRLEVFGFRIIEFHYSLLACPEAMPKRISTVRNRWRGPWRRSCAARSFLRRSSRSNACAGWRERKTFRKRIGSCY